MGLVKWSGEVRIVEFAYCTLCVLFSLPLGAGTSNTEDFAGDDLAVGQFTLGMKHLKGEEISLDYLKAFRHFSESARRGHAHAQYQLGMLYQSGKGVEQDHAAACRWFQKAAEQGIAGSQYELALSYERGRGIRQDYDLSLIHI